LEHLAGFADNPSAAVLGKALDQGTAKFLVENKSPTRRVGGIDNRGSHFYLAMYWAEALANQDEDAGLKEIFTGVYAQMAEKEEAIVAELNGAQGSSVDVAGYYKIDPALAASVMRPSATLNAIVDAI
ncbi:MAG: NADP-dependent isocitrate dehydrogenase, partial [Oceanobacter sp.]